MLKEERDRLTKASLKKAPPVSILFPGAGNATAGARSPTKADRSMIKLRKYMLQK